MKQMPELKMLPISELKLADYNPRKKLTPHDMEFRKLKKSIEEHGFAESVVVNKDMTVIGGHLRIQVAKALGYTVLPCTMMDLNKKQEKALNIALNKISGYWDEAKLAELISELDEDSFDLMCIGFDAPEVNALFNKVYNVGIREEKPEALTMPRNYTPISMYGDVWELGQHRILCGDATKWADYCRLLGNVKANLVCIDSPYFVRLKNSKTGVITNDDLPEDQAAPFLHDTFHNLFRCMKDDASIYVFYASTNSTLFFMEYEQAGFHVGAVPVWVKDKAPLSRGDFNFRYEPIIYGWKKEGKHHWYGDGSDTTVLEYPSIRDSAKDGCGHPSSKPLQLIAYLIRLSSRQKGVVVDTFLGSGTTLIACEQQRRQCYGMEIEPRFVDLCCRRYISYKNAEDDVYLIRDGNRYSWAEANLLSQKGGAR